MFALIDKPVTGTEQAFDVHALVALLTDRSEDGGAVGSRLDRLVVEVHEEAAHVEFRTAVLRGGLQPDDQAALRLGRQQPAALRPGLCGAAAGGAG